MTGQQLKNSILQMAVQGKLVPQDPNDEPASVLLARIRKEKEELIKAGKIKKEKNSSYIFRSADNLPYEKVGKNEPVCIADEVPFEIPESWVWVRIKSLGAIIRGSGIKRNETVESGYPCVRYGEIYTTYNTSFTSTVSFIPKEINEKCRHFSYGDILMTLTGENKPDIAKAVAYLGTDPVAAGGDLAYWTAHGMNPLFLSYLLASPYVINRKVELATGDIIVHISGDKIGSILIPIPPLNEQIRIVEKIQETEYQIRQYGEKEQELTILHRTFPESMKKSILLQAVQGKLVEQNPEDESAEVLLERISAEKQRLIKEGKIKKDKHESIIFRRDNSHYEKRGSEEVCIDDEIPFELPNGWCWCRFSNICYKLTDGSHNPPPKKSTGFRVISAKNIKNGQVVFTDEDRLCDQQGFNKENPRTKISKGDVILGIIGGSIGNTAIYEHEEPVIAQRSIAIFGSMINNQYMKLLLDSPLFQQQFSTKSNGTAQGGIYLGELAKMLIPLPPHNEQTRILLSVNNLKNYLTGM